MHEIATPEMLNASFYTFEWRAAQHVFVHHGNGDAFGPSFLFDPVFSSVLYLYGYLHNEVLHLIPGSLSHYSFAISFDVLLGILLGFIITGVYLCGHMIYMAVGNVIGNKWNSLFATNKKVN